MASKINSGLVPVLQEFNRIWFAVNRELLGGRYPDPLFTVQAAGRKKDVLGWCTTGAMWANVGDRDATRFEINVCAEALRRGGADVANTLLHEMAHYANWYDGVKDCTVNQYHNQHFKRRAEALGLEVELMGNRGWASTKLAAGALVFLGSIGGVQEDAFRFYRVDETAGGAKKKGSKMKKYTCACTTVRCATELRALCLKCRQPFEREEVEEDGASED